MDETVKEFYDMPNAWETSSRVMQCTKEADARYAVILDKTLFYPEGGGQPCDLGYINNARVVNVTEKDGVIIHSVEQAFEQGETVLLRIDKARRIDHREQHSAQHVLSSVLLRTLGGVTLSFHLGEEYSLIDSNIAPVPQDAVYMLEDEINKIIYNDYKVITHLCPPEDIHSFPLRKEPKVDAALMRIVEFDGIEYTACCGTHVASTKDIALFRILRIEKYKGGSRIYFVAGGRALKDYRRLSDIAREAASVGGISENDIPDRMAQYKEKVKALEYECAGAKDRAAAARAELLARGAFEVGYEDSFDAAQRLVKALAKKGRAAFIACAPELKVAAAGSGLKIILDALRVKYSGAGGGSDALYQAAFNDTASFEAFVREASAQIATR